MQKINYKHTYNHTSAYKFGNIICKSLETKMVQYMLCLDKLHNDSSEVHYTILMYCPYQKNTFTVCV